MKLDLHGVKHADVDKELDSFLYEHLQTKNLQVDVVCEYYGINQVDTFDELIEFLRNHI